MSNKKQNEELQSRREFFKKAAKAALPVVGIIAFPYLSQAQAPLEYLPNPNIKGDGCSDCTGYCSGGCKDSCLGACKGNCKGDCTGSSKGSSNNSSTGCVSGCYGGCSGGCTGSCYRTCRSTCSGGAYY